MKRIITLLSIAIIGCLTQIAVALAPPMTVKAVWEDVGTDYGQKKMWSFSLAANGSYTGMVEEENKSWHTQGTWQAQEPIFIKGTWTTKTRSIGGKSQKVYAIRLNFGAFDGDVYLPADCKYMWMGNWNQCSRNAVDSNTTWPIKSAKAGTTTFKKATQSSAKATVKYPCGKVLEVKNDQYHMVVSFRNEKGNALVINHWSSGREDDTYTISGNQIKFSKNPGLNGTLSADGSRLDCNKGFTMEEIATHHIADGVYGFGNIYRKQYYTYFINGQGKPILLKPGNVSDGNGLGSIWNVVNNNDGTVTISSWHEPWLAIDLVNAEAKEKAPIMLWEQNGTCAQRWIPEYMGFGEYIFRSSCNPKFFLSTGYENNEYLAKLSEYTDTYKFYLQKVNGFEVSAQPFDAPAPAQVAANSPQPAPQAPAPQSITLPKPVASNAILSEAKHYKVRGVEFDMHPVKGIGIGQKDYYIGKTEVTQALWDAVMFSNSSELRGPNRPVTNINWMDCWRFILRLNQITGKCFRLPTQAEWEYADKGGGLPKHKLAEEHICWSAKNSGNQSQDVASLLCDNDLNLYDMRGNVWEWIDDASTNAAHIMGRCYCDNFDDGADYIQTHGSHQVWGTVGFRLALTPEPMIIIPNGIYFVGAEANSDLVLDNTGYNVADCNNIQIWHKLAEDNKMWRVYNHGDGSISLLSMQNSNFAVTLRDDNCYDHGNIELISYNGHRTQRWMPKKTTSGAYILQNCMDKNYVITVADNNINAEANVELININNSPGGHTWKFTAVK